MSASVALPDRRGDTAAARPVYRFEVRVRTVMSHALVASLPVRASGTAVPRRAVYRLCVDGERDIADVVASFSRAGVQVLEITARPKERRPVPAA